MTFLETRLAGLMPHLDMFPYDGRIPKGERLRTTIEKLLAGRQPADAVIALTDVYTAIWGFGGGGNNHFYPHVAQYDFEAWLLPYWHEIQKIAGHNRNAPSGPPETVNHRRPPSQHIREIFRIGKCRDDYSKPRDGNRILRGQGLSVAVNRCPELKAFISTIITLSGGSAL